ncbi:Alpha/Beta hydrolase protein [Coniella lustricola]|uniref:Alpha/Beta hydrolase protein n=1 Tax=Coniella lustricola TaxID=2025994 RepID=A0A2T3A0I1_9PEZI|nr:Alpha/Beta hydrolase protein [Coniella lustricola]
MVGTEDTSGAAAGDEIKPYKVHVSSKYLELTRQKLELTRLPHEAAGSRPSEDWWEPKPQIESLIDYWLEKYSWRDHEETLNQTPQFRTAIAVPGADAPLRLHFVHVKSTRDGAVPLLLIPPFPFSNLALLHLVELFTNPQEADAATAGNTASSSSSQAFDLVIPALPGLGFSDPFPTNTPEIATTAELLNTVMTRLGYQHYIVTNCGPARFSPAEIDWKLINYLSTHYQSSCLGAHFIAPSLAKPKLSEAPIEWAKWTIASTLGAGILGYSQQDFSALKSTPVGTQKSDSKAKVTSYAMCDSPVGLLSVVMRGLSLQGPRIQLRPEQIITFTNLAWLPGPEYSMRFWAHCAADNEDASKSQAKKAWPPSKPNVGITVFLGGEQDDREAAEEGASTAQEVGEEAIRLESPNKVDIGAAYACPAWGKIHYNVLFSQRVAGKPGLLAWERPDVILAGVIGLVAEILKVDKRLQPHHALATTPLETVAVTAAENEEQDEGDGEALLQAQSDGLKPPERPMLEQGDSSRTHVASEPPASPKGKEIETASENLAKPDETIGDKEFARDASVDTVVLVTAPTGEKTKK